MLILVEMHALTTKHKSLILISIFLVICIFLYSYIFSNIFRDKYFFWSSDAEIMSYPSRVFLYNSIVNEHTFPFWTERIFFGYAPYVDMQVAFLNPVNTVSIIIFGPVWSYKIVHFLTYLLGSLSFYYFALKFVKPKRHQNLLVIVAAVGAVASFYFSFFNINHLIHMNLVAITMLVPVHLFIADKMLTTHRLTYALLQGLLLAYSVLWGHPQSTIMSILLVSGYILALSPKKELVKNALILILTLVLMVGLSLHQIIPSISTALSSSRVSTKLDFADYSLMPQTALSIIYPFMYGRWSAYQGLEVSSAFTFVEFYNYVGIVGFIILILFFLFSKKDRLYWFLYTSTLIFLIFSFWHNLPILKDFNFPLITLFRYWTRSAEILTIVISLAVIKFCNSEDFNLKEFKSGLKALLPLVVLIILAGVGNPQNSIYQQVIENFQNFNFSVLLKKDLLIWFICLLSTLMLFLISLKRSKMHSILYICIIVISISELAYFTRDIIPVRIMKYSKNMRYTISDEFNNKRILEEKFTLAGYQPLLTQAWTPYGYSLFVDADYSNFYINNNLGRKLRMSVVSESFRPDINVDALKKANVYAVLLKESPVYMNNTRDYKEQVIEDTYKSFETDLASQKNITFPVKFDKNWKISINGQNVFATKDEVFSQLAVPKGKSVIEFNYYPSDVIFGSIVGLFTSLFAIFFLRKSYKKNELTMNKRQLK